MAEENQLEKIAQAAPQVPQQKPEEQKKEEKKPVGALENVVNEVGSFGKSLVKLAAAGALTFGLMTAAPSYARDIAIRTPVQIAADATTNYKKGQKTDSKEILRSAAVGSAVTIPVSASYRLTNLIPTDTALGYVGKGAFFGALYAPFVGIYQTVDYLVRNLTFKGLGKYLKENYWTTLKRAWKQILPLDLINALFFPPYLQIPVSAALMFTYALFGAPKKGEVPAEKKRDPTPYYVVAPRVAGRLAYEAVNKLVYSPLKALYEIGSNLYKATPAKPATPATPAGQPAPAHG